MSNQQLSEYIKQELQKGKSKDEIKNSLLGAGWKESQINQFLGSSNVPVPPKPKEKGTSFTSTGLQHLDPRAVWLFFFTWLFYNVVFIFIVFFYLFVDIASLGEEFWIVAILISLSVIVLTFIWSKLTYHFYRYELTEEGFRKELGVIIKKYVTIPYDRIQNVDINRGILARLLGLSDLNIQTAGTGVGQFGEGRLPGLSIEVAENLRNELIHRSRQTKNQGL